MPNNYKNTVIDKIGGTWDVPKKEDKCLGCGDTPTRTDNTLCQDCWYDAEGE